MSDEIVTSNVTIRDTHLALFVNVAGKRLLRLTLFVEFDHGPATHVHRYVDADELATLIYLANTWTYEELIGKKLSVTSPADDLMMVAKIGSYLAPEQTLRDIGTRSPR